MLKYFFKVFGIIVAILTGLGVAISGIILSFATNTVLGIVVLIVVIAAIVATLITVVEFSSVWD